MEVNPSYIIYDSLYSQWLSNAIEAVSNNISSLGINDSYSNYNFKNLINLRDKEDERNNNGWKNDNELDIVFISDLIHTGTTFKDSIKKIAKKFPKGNIHCLSALITDVAYNEYKAEFEETDRQITINDHNVRYFKKVEQIYSVKSSNRTKCNMCKHRLLPPVRTSERVSKNLSSFEMWLMSEESGYKIEDYRPRKNRENENRIVPDSLKLFKKNGTLLAIKFEEHLKLSDIYPSDEIAILFPDETKNDIEGVEHLESIEKTPSGYFAKCLNFYNENYSYLGIPRKMIRLLEESENWDNVKEQFPKIVKQIEDIDKPIVIVDEVNFTGMTFRTITDILYNIQSKSPICYFPIFNFDAQGTFTKYDDTRYQKIKFLTLYELEFAHG